MLLKLEHVSYQPRGAHKLKPLTIEGSAIVGDGITMRFREFEEEMSFFMRTTAPLYKLVVDFELCVPSDTHIARLGLTTATPPHSLEPEKVSKLSLKALKAKAKKPMQVITWASWLKNKSLWGLLLEGDESTKLLTANTPDSICAWELTPEHKLRLHVIFQTETHLEQKVILDCVPSSTEEPPNISGQGFVRQLEAPLTHESLSAQLEQLDDLNVRCDAVILPGLHFQPVAKSVLNFPKKQNYPSKFGLQIAPHLLPLDEVDKSRCVRNAEGQPVKVKLKDAHHYLLDFSNPTCLKNLQTQIRELKAAGFMRFRLLYLDAIWLARKSSVNPNIWMQTYLDTLLTELKPHQLYCEGLSPQLALRYRLNSNLLPSAQGINKKLDSKAGESLTAALHDTLAVPVPYPRRLNSQLSLLPKDNKMPLDDAGKYSLLMASILYSDTLLFQDPLDKLQPAALAALPSLIPHRRPHILRRISERNMELYEVRRNGRFYNIVFNFSNSPLTVELPDYPCFDTTEMAWRPASYELRVDPQDARLTLQIRKDWSIAGGSEHILPGCGVADFDVDQEMEEISLTLYDSVPEQAQVFVRIPDDIDGAMVNGMFIRSTTESGQNILRIDARNCPRRAAKKPVELEA